MDVLTDVLNTLELKGWLSSCIEVTTSWRFDFAASRDIPFHILNFGGGYLYLEEEPTPRQVKDGDILVFPSGHAHSLCDDLTAPFPKRASLDYDPHRECQVFPFEGEGVKTVLLCGAFHFEYPDEYPLLQFLPEVIHIPGEQGRLAPGLADLMPLIVRESASRQPGAEALLRRLIEMLFIQIIRMWIDKQVDRSSGWLTALQDQPISAALGLIHHFPERRWKVEELAESVALSRSAFAARFTSLVGTPPMKYVTRWRMHLATRLLRKEGKMEQIEQQLGYDSEVAFRKAFKREVGLSPAQYRKRKESSGVWATGKNVH
jgi:AraC-like DNA-binding protein